MIEAAFGNSNEVIAELINKGADLNAKTNLDWSAAMESADNNQNPNVLKTLISAGANITKPNKDGWTPIFEKQLGLIKIQMC